MDRRLKVALAGVSLVVVGILLSVPNVMNYFGTLLKGYDAKYGIVAGLLTILGIIMFLFGLFIISAGLKKLSFVFTILGILIFIFAVGAIYSYNGVVTAKSNNDVKHEVRVDPSSPNAVLVEIPMNSNTSQIADILYKSGIIKKPTIFKLLSKLNGFDGRYQAGTHVLSKSLELDTIMTILTNKPESVKVTIPEGMTYKQVVDLFIKKGIATKDDFDRAMKYEKYDYTFLKSIKNTNNREYVLEGYLFPDTYEFAMNADEKTIVKVMLENLNNKLTKEHYARAKELGMSMDEIITLASIIEREASTATDRRLVSAVFHKRLKSNVPTVNKLQSCATIQYEYLKKDGKVKEKLTYKDTELDSPYNTYIHRGLPPGPICSPGMDAINAALYPDEDTEYMYFIAKGDGTTKFTKTYKEHLKAMREYGLAK